MRLSHRAIRPLLGPVTSVDKALLGDSYAEASGNSRYERGTVKPRYGFRNFRAAQASFVASYGIHDLVGLSSAGVVTREHLSFEDIGGTVKPYSRSVSTGAPTVVTDGASALSLHASQWRKVAWEDKAYFFNPNDANYRLAEHTVGTATSFTAIKPPTAPATALSVSFIKNVLTGATDAYRSIEFSGIAAADIALSGDAAGGTPQKSVSNGRIKILLDPNKTGSLEVTVTLNGAGGPGSQDLTYNDRLFQYLTCRLEATGGAGGVKVNPATFKVAVVNNDGSPVTMNLTTKAGSDDGNVSLSSIADFDHATLRSLKDNVVKVKYTVTVTACSATEANNQIWISPPELGCVNPDVLPTNGNSAIDLLYSYKNSTTGQESDLAMYLPVMNYQWIGGIKTVPTIGRFNMGTLIKVTATGSAESGVDKWVLYSFYDPIGQGRVRERAQSDGSFRIEGEFTDSGADLSQYLWRSLSEWSQLSTFSASTAPRIDSANIKCAGVHNGSMVWGFKGGTDNVRLSYVGQPLRLYTDLDSQTGDDVLGADLTMAPDLTDEPEALHSAGGVLVMLGSRGVYHSFGERPVLQRPTKKVPESQGTAGPNASCDWRGDDGVPGVAYLSSNLDTLWFVRVADQSNPEAIELSIKERGRVKSHLFGSVTPTAEDIYVGVDPRSDALWIRYQNKAVVYRRANLVDGERHFEFYSYTVTGTFYDCFFSDLYGMRSMRSTGQIDEVEYDSTNSFAAIEGTLRDAGAAMPECHWTSKTFTGRRKRVVRMRCDRDALTDRPTVTLTQDGTARAAVQFASGAEWIKLPVSYQGRNLQIKVVLAEGSGELKAIEWEEAEVDQRYAS